MKELRLADFNFTMDARLSSKVWAPKHVEKAVATYFRGLKLAGKARGEFGFKDPPSPVRTVTIGIRALKIVNISKQLRSRTPDLDGIKLRVGLFAGNAELAYHHYERVFHVFSEKLYQAGSPGIVSFNESVQTRIAALEGKAIPSYR